MHSASRPHPSHLPARSRVTLHHHHQPCGDSDRGKGSTRGINPWICPPASAFLRFPSQHCCFIHGMAPPGFFQCPLPTWGQTQPSKSQACCRQQSPAPAPQHPSSMAPVGSFHRKTHRILLSLAPDRDAGRCSIPEATAHSAGTHATAPTPNPSPGPSPQVLRPRALTLHVSPGMVALGCRGVCVTVQPSRCWELGPPEPMSTDTSRQRHQTEPIPSPSHLLQKLCCPNAPPLYKSPGIHCLQPPSQQDLAAEGSCCRALPLLMLLPAAGLQHGTATAPLILSA